jgi:hypothetical protein
LLLGGAGEDRTPDPLRARQVLSQLSYDPNRTRNTVNKLNGHFAFLYIKEVIQPQVPLRLPCYDFTPVMNHTVVNALLAVKPSTSGAAHSHGVTGGVYKARERIHRNILICDY